MEDAIEFLPYGALIDHFQHEVYANPHWSHQQRMQCFRDLEKSYLPHKNYDEIPILEKGGWWLRQLHVFMDPFYYIDYTLAQVCALQFGFREDADKMKDYFHICEIGGLYSFREIVKQAHLKDPFAPDTMEFVMDQVKKYFDLV